MRKKGKFSIEKSRKEIYRDLKNNCENKDIIKKEIPFENEDVPNYLKELLKIEKESKQINIRVC